MTVERATVSVTVTGAQEAAAPVTEDGESPPAPEFPLTSADGDAGMTVTYLVDVEVPWMVVVRPSEEEAAAPVTSAGLVA